MKIIELKTISATCPDPLTPDQALKIYRKAQGLANRITDYYNSLHTQGTRMSPETQWKVRFLNAISDVAGKRAALATGNHQNAFASLLEDEDSISIQAAKAIQGQTLCSLMSSHESGVGDVGFELGNVGVFFEAKTQLKPDEVQHYRIIETRMETQSGIFETNIHYYEPCHSTAEGAFEPSGNDFVRVSAGLHTMGVEWVELKPEPLIVAHGARQRKTKGGNTFLSITVTSPEGHVGTYEVLLAPDGALLDVVDTEEDRKVLEPMTEFIDSNLGKEELQGIISQGEAKLANELLPGTLAKINCLASFAYNCLYGYSSWRGTEGGQRAIWFQMGDEKPIAIQPLPPVLDFQPVTA